jgi:hypothetical protein
MAGIVCNLLILNYLIKKLIISLNLFESKLDFLLQIEFIQTPKSIIDSINSVSETN